jgi:eukaryotic-like serine/threonine-protein kinase
MPIDEGTLLGRYEIRSKIGEGGMGEVYLAEDLTLRRKVALKILALDVAANKDRMRRFEQEAQAAAALNHPNIATIHEIGEHEGTRFIAMEFIDGVTLREKIHQERTELPKLLRFLQHTAEGLAKAHAAGIIHRDLKPDNIMVTRDGHAKILDFGLVKLIEPQNASSESPSEVATALMKQHSTPGMILGTAGYMSPEQAQGKTNQIDHRSDIFSFGCILYEAITRRKAFEGKDLIDTLNKLIREPVTPITDFNPTAPPDLQRIVRRCVVKDPDERYQTIKDVAIELKEVRRELQGAEPHTTAPPSSVTSAEVVGSEAVSASAISSPDSLVTRPSSAEYLVTEIKRHKTSAAVVIVLLALVLAAAGYSIYKWTAKRSSPALSLQSAKFTRLTASGKVTDAAISPDGKYVAHVIDDGGRQSLWVRQVATQSNVQIVAPADVRFIGLAFSLDGDYVYYTLEEKGSALGLLHQVPSLGGTPRKVLADVAGPISFSPDGKRFAYLSYSFQNSEDLLMIANSDGSGARKLAGRGGNEQFYRGTGALSWSPDGKTIATSAGVTSPDNYMTVVAVSVESGEIKFFTPQKWQFVDRVAWLADGMRVLVIESDPVHLQSQIWQVSYPAGEAQRLTNDPNNYMAVSLNANSDTLVTVQRERVANIWVLPFNDSTHATQITFGRQYDNDPAWTPGGAVFYDSNAGGSVDLYIIDARGGNPEQLTTNSSFKSLPSVSPDGHYIAFNCGLRICRIDIDGSNAKQLTNGLEFDPQWSPDGRFIVYVDATNNSPQIWRVSANGNQPVRLIASKLFAIAPTVSPDGKQVACYYQDNGPLKIAVLPIGGGEPTRTFDAQAFGFPWTNLRWTLDGRAIVHVVTRGGVSNLWSQPVDGSAPKQITNFTSDRLFRFDLSRDGKQLALSRGTVTSDVLLITNFR